MAQLESQTLDFKESWQDDHLKTLCAFANSEGGSIHLGKDDQGNIVPLSDTKKLLETLPGKIIQKLGLYPKIGLVQSGPGAFIAITVDASPFPIPFNGKYYQRIGSTNQELKGQTLANFLMEKGNKGWDDLPEPQAQLADIDVDAIATFKRLAVHRLPAIQSETDTLTILQKLQLAEGSMLKKAAVLLFGKDPQRYYRDAYIKIGMFASDTDLLSDDNIQGNLFEQVERTVEVLRLKYLVSKVYYEGLVRKEKPEYPEAALREAIINSVIHRDFSGPPVQISVYDDKLILWNDGPLPPSISVEDLKKKHVSRPRNKTLSDIFYKAGYIEAWGRGTIAITEECIKAGLPEPQFREAFGGLEVTFFKDTLNEKTLQQLPLNDRQRKAIQYLKQYNRITNKKYQELTDCSRNTATNDLKELIDLNIIQQAGRRGAGSYFILK